LSLRAMSEGYGKPILRFIEFDWNCLETIHAWVEGDSAARASNCLD